MFEYKIDDITIYNSAAAFDIRPKTRENIEKFISAWIIEHLEAEIVNDIIEKNYEGFCPDDKIQIQNHVAAALELSKERRREYIERRLSDYFAGEYLINISGFVRFRLKDYRSELEEVVDRTIDKYICEREYNDFIALIKEYVEYQDTGINTLNVITTPDNKNRYFDGFGNELTKVFMTEYSFETDLTEDDKLLTILVLSAPKCIIWHNWSFAYNAQLKETVKAIFGDSLIFCGGCEMCRNIKK